MFHEGQPVVATEDPTDTDKAALCASGRKSQSRGVSQARRISYTAIATHYPLIEDAALAREAERLPLEHARAGGAHRALLAQQNQSYDWSPTCC